ncbi:MAG: hypothetical protein ABWZ66_09575, partial [Pyrinomonadaceae bacterium]
EMFLRVQEFILARIAAFPAASFAGAIFVGLQANIAAIAGLSGQQLSNIGGKGMAQDTRDEARDKLYIMLQDISGYARSLSFVVSGLENKFRIGDNRSDQSLIALGRAFIKDALEYKAQFLEAKLDEDFIEKLTAATDALEQAVAQLGSADQAKIGSTASFATHIAAGMIACRRLDPIIKRMYRNSAADKAAWTSARHVERSASTATDTTKQPNQ